MNGITKMCKSVSASAGKHAPGILTAFGLLGMAAAIVEAVRATPKAVQLIEERRSETEQETLPVKEVVQATWKCYIPTAIAGIGSAACFIAAHTVNVKRSAAFAAAYTLSSSALKEYKEKTLQTVGKKTAQNIQDAIAKDAVQKKPASKSEVVVTGKGTTKCYDVVSGRYFYSSIEAVKKAGERLNRRIRDEMWVSVNDFYDELGIDRLPYLDPLGWDIDKGYPDLEFSSQLDDAETPCLVIGYQIAPKYDPVFR